jgi:ribonucleoside-diphosphate reductase alpha chain
MSLENLNTAEYSKFIHKSRYARWIDKANRREEWDETIDRLCGFWKEQQPEFTEVEDRIRKAITDVEVMPSMRSMMTAGKALDRDNVAGYNCSYVAVDHPRVFDETMYILMCGTGLGFSVERQYINQLPEVAEEFHTTDTTIVVADSKIGWASSFRQLVSLLYQGMIPKWDTSKVRKSGAKLKTFGGRASGPEPLEDLFRFTQAMFIQAAGRKLNSIECHDLMCKIADIVVVGGVRRSALISLSNLTDQRMRVAKSGQWWLQDPQRALANNSVCYTEKPDIGIFMDEWKALYTSKSGERGIFNREAAIKQQPARRAEFGYTEYGCNPCSEIVLRSKSFCNLTEVVIRADDTLETLMQKMELATILGTFQSTLTKFRYLSSVWKKNCEEERLLGVSLTGIMDNPVMNGSEGMDKLKKWLTALKEHAINVNKEWAEKLGINPASAITCVKPSGTVSQLVDSASGIHPRYAPYYIRTVRADKKDPLAQMMLEMGFPCEDDLMKPDTGYVFSFPVKSPEGSVFRDDRTALEQLELWKVYQEAYCEHKPSITVYVKEHEWLQVASWVYDNFDSVSGVAFLPHSDHSGLQAPYQECDEDAYNELVSEMPRDIDWTNLANYEKVDTTEGMKEFACTGTSCEFTGA